MMKRRRGIVEEVEAISCSRPTSQQRCLQRAERGDCVLLSQLKKQKIMTA
jgi:hypothetical protein